MIPKKIHYCWFGEKPLPKEVKKCIASWQKYCPDYEIIQWNESNFDINSNKFMLEAYKQKAWAFVSDYARLKIVYEQGGIYLDTDVEMLKNVDFLLKNQCYLGIGAAEKLCNTGLGFGAEPHNVIILKMLNEYNNIAFLKENIKVLACPYLNHKVLKEIGYEFKDDIVRLDSVTVFPPRFFDPYGENKNLLCKDTISIHHYSASWLGGKVRLKRKMISIIGEGNILKIKKMLKKE